MEIKLINKRSGDITEVSIDGKSLKIHDRVLLIYENEEVSVDTLMPDFLYIRDDKGWFGSRKYSEINLVINK